MLALFLRRGLAARQKPVRASTGFMEGRLMIARLCLHLTFAFFLALPPSETLAQGTTTEKISLSRSHRGKAVTITGELLVPPGTGKVPAMLIVHGSSGLKAAWEGRYAREMVKLGVAAL